LANLKLAAVKLLEVPEATVEQALSQMLTNGGLLQEDIDGESLIFMPHLRKSRARHRHKDQGAGRNGNSLPPDRFLEGGRMVRATNGQEARPQSACGAENNSCQPRRDHYRGTGRGQDDACELNPDYPAGQRCEVPAVRSDRTGGEAARGDHRVGSGSIQLSMRLQSAYGRMVNYDFGELDEIALAYAITIHKSQGSEFPAVVIPLATQHYMLLQRNLIYRGITRGKRLLVLIGQKKALGIAVRNDRPQRRYSGLFASLSTSGTQP
jgi:hypothetical protein